MNVARGFLLADTWMHGGWGWGWMTMMMTVMVLFWGGVILGIVWLIRGAAEGRPERRSDSPTEVLDRRFAEGAISVEDYQARKQVLSGGIAESSNDTQDEPLTAQAAGGKR